MARIDPRWPQLLTSERFERTDDEVFKDRGPFDRDYDRIIYSSNFRRLKDKTQVFPLSSNDFVRTRLTHSLEVASLGRTLGRKVQELLNPEVSAQADISAIVASACLAHDIGNPPFGHSGEFAIQEWARANVRAASDLESGKPYTVDTIEQRQDLHDFDGNAQSLRVVTRIQTRRRPGGMQLTYATVGAMMKYPCSSLIDGMPRGKNVDQKKCGYFQDDAIGILAALKKLGLKSYGQGAFRRHPLAFLVEAADDISNAIIDLEDTVDQGLIEPAEAIALLAPIAQKTIYARKYGNDRDELERLRAFATNSLVEGCADVFSANLTSILDGDFQRCLVDETKYSDEYEAIRKAISAKAHKHRSVLEIEAAGFRVIEGLLDFFVPALVNPSLDLRRRSCNFLRKTTSDKRDRLATMNRRLKR